MNDPLGFNPFENQKTGRRCVLPGCSGYLVSERLVGSGIHVSCTGLDCDFLIDIEPSQAPPGYRVIEPYVPLGPAPSIRCVMADCVASPFAYELCRSCFRLWCQAGRPDYEAFIGDVSIKRRESSPCGVDGCGRAGDGGGGLCGPHRVRWRRSGRPSLAIFIIAQARIPFGHRGGRRKGASV